jgi:SAM-dependent methyltransferase
MKACALGRLSLAALACWLAPVALVGNGSATWLASALVCATIQIAVLLPCFILALRLDRRHVSTGAGWGAVTGAVLTLAPAIALGAPDLLACAVLSGAATGAWFALVLRFQADGERHWFPRAPIDRRPSHRWYWGRAVYVSRRDYWRIFVAFISVGAPLGVAGLVGPRVLFHAALAIAAIGVLLLVYSLFGLYRMYGPPSLRYYRRLLDEGGVRDGAVIADLHIGTYRTAFAIADLLPRTTIHSIDCWDVQGPPAEAAVADVRELEPAPIGIAQIHPTRADAGTLPLADASCDAVVFGFGTHEIPTDGPRERLFAEARRILKPGGIALLFEHGYDLHNYFIFGPVIDHVTRRAEWLATMRTYFADVTYARSSAAVDMLAGRRHA